MKVLIAVFLPDMRPGGAERLHIDLARQWRKSGAAVDMVLRQARGELVSQCPQDIRIVDLRAARVRNVILPLSRYLRQAQPDVLLTAMWPLTFIAPLTARLVGFRGRVVVSEHSPLSRAYAHRGIMHRWALRTTMRIGYSIAAERIGVSSGVADDMAQLSSLPRARFKVVNNPAATGLPTERHSRPMELKKITGPVILTVGTLKKVKRHDIVLDAFARIAPASDATLCILGEGSERNALETQIARLGLAGRVLMPGYIEDPSPWYAAADLFVLSSDYEGFGNVIVEAMEHGVPIVSTDCPFGPAEILANGRFGRLVPVGDVSAFADAMRDALAAPRRQELLRTRAQDFRVDRIAQQYLEVMLPEQFQGRV